MFSFNLDHYLPTNLPSKCPLQTSLIRSIPLKKLCGDKGHVLFGSNKGTITLSSFTCVANTRYRYNLIQSLHYQEESLTTNFDISNAFTSYFSQFFGAPHHPLLHANWDILYLNCE